MRTIFMTVVFSSSVFTTALFADETVAEKAQAIANETKLEVKKAANRISEKLCQKGDLECAAERVKNRAIEAKDAAVNAAKKTKNIVD